MHKIILLVGDSGAGKDFVLSAINNYTDIEVIKKYISREPRNGEEDSISSVFSVAIEDIQNMDYYYEGVEAGRWYGIKKSDLEETLASGKSPIVVCPNYECFFKMSKDFPNMVVNFFIYRGYGDLELEQCKKSLLDRGSSEKEIQARKDKRDQYFKELYIDHFYDYSSNVILNIYDITTKDDIIMQFEGLCLKNDIELNSKKIVKR